MKKFLKSLLVVGIVVFLASCKSYVRPIEGATSLSFLAGQENVNVVFKYESVSVNEYANEEDYIEESMSKRNEEEPGAGDDWNTQWFGQRDAVFEPEFIEAINQYNDKGLNFSKTRDNAKYTLYVDVIYMKTGWNVGVMRKNAEVDLKVKFVETSSLENGVKDSEALFKVIDVPGYGDLGYDFAVSQRLGAAFEMAGKEFGNYISDQEF